MAELVARTGDEGDRVAALGVLAETYGEGEFTDDWFRWKHREGPWGSSRLVLVEDAAHGVVGVVLAIPWGFRDGAQAVPGARLVDGATLPSSRGRGVFGASVAEQLRQWKLAERPGVMLGTTNEAASRAHVRNGAVLLRLHHAQGFPVGIPTGRVEVGDHVLDGYVDDGRTGLHTDWSGTALRWRTDPRSGRSYEAARLVSADEPNGMVYRVLDARRPRVLQPVVTWGSPADRRRLVASVARCAGTPVVLVPSGPGARRTRVLRAVRRPGSLLCVWGRRGTVGPRTGVTTTDWSLEFGDLEGVL